MATAGFSVCGISCASSGFKSATQTTVTASMRKPSIIAMRGPPPRRCHCSRASHAHAAHPVHAAIATAGDAEKSQ
jgi:hypothetical protein